MSEPSGMTLADYQASALAKWARAQDRTWLRAHIFHCLRTGDRHNAFWELWDLVHGKRGFQPDEIDGALDAIIDALLGVGPVPESGDHRKYGG